jgi:hypothetical protein
VSESHPTEKPSFEFWTTPNRRDAMHIESSIRDFSDGSGRVWLAYQAIAVNGTRRAVPWVTFIQLATGERRSGRAVGALTAMDDGELSELLESFGSSTD